MHQNDGGVITNFIVQALKNEPITIYGDGSQTRSFCFVDDLITALVVLMRTPVHFVGPVNLGDRTSSRSGNSRKKLSSLLVRRRPSTTHLYRTTTRRNAARTSRLRAARWMGANDAARSGVGKDHSITSRACSCEVVVITAHCNESTESVPS